MAVTKAKQAEAQTQVAKLQVRWGEDARRSLCAVAAEDMFTCTAARLRLRRSSLQRWRRS